MAIAAVSGTYNMIHPDPAVRADGLARLATMIRAAPLMGTRLVTLCTGTRHATDQWAHHPDNASAAAWQRSARPKWPRPCRLPKNAASTSASSRSWPTSCRRPNWRGRLIDELGSPRIRIVLDPANLFETASAAEARAIVARAVDLLGDRIVMAHAKDRRADGSFAAAGSGVIDFRHFVRSLRSAGFDGPLVTHGLSEAEAPAVAAFLRRVVAEEAAA